MEPVTTTVSFYLLPLFIAGLKTFGFLGFSGLGFYWLSRRWVAANFANPLELLGISLVAGPLLTSWIFVQSLRLFPAQSPSFYTTPGNIVVLVLGLLGLYYFSKDIRTKNENYYDKTGANGSFAFRTSMFENAQKYNKIYILVVIILGLVLLSYHTIIMTQITILTPFSANDPLEYAFGSRLIATQRDISLYPFVDVAKTGGFYGAWTHPPAYLGLMSWTYLGNTGSDFGARLVSIYFVITTLFSAWAFSVRRSPMHALFVVIFAVFAPSIYVLGIISHVDPIRISGLVLAAFAVYRLIYAYSIRNLIFCALVLGLAQFTHSIGILSSMLILPAYFICAQVSVLRRIIHVVCMFVLALVIISPDIYNNYMTFGAIIQDYVPLWGIAELEIQELRNYYRNLGTWPEKIIFGLFKGFSNQGAFGKSYPFFAFALIASFVYLFWSNKRSFIKELLTLRFFQKPPLHIYCLLIIMGFYAMVIGSMVAGTDIIIKNARYFMTVQYFVAVFTGFVFAEIATKLLVGERFHIFRKIPDNKLVFVMGCWVLGACVLTTSAYGLYHHSAFKSQKFREFNMVSSTKFGGYEQKMKAGKSRIYPAVWFLNTLVETGKLGPEDVVLVFRKAEAAFYGKFKIRTHFDDDLLGVFTADTKNEILIHLQERNIRYLLIPPYAQAEVYNSQLAELLGDENYAALLFSSQGTKVYEIYEPGSERMLQVTSTTSASSKMVSKIVAVDESKQRVYATRCPLFGACEHRSSGTENQRVFDEKFEFFPSKSTRGAFAWGGLHYLKLKTADNAGETFIMDPGIYKISAEVEAQGFVRIVLFSYPKLLSGADRRVQSTTLWSGLMSGSKNIVSQFEVVPPYTSFAEWRKNEDKPVKYGLAVELQGQGSATIGKLTVEQTNANMAFTGNRRAQYNDMKQNQWTVKTPRIDPVLLVPVNNSGNAIVDNPYREHVKVVTIDGRPLQVKGPVYELNSNDVLDAYGTVAAGVLSNTALGPLTDVVGYSVKLGFSGKGVIQIGVEYECRTGRGGSMSFGWYLAEEFEQEIERDIKPKCSVQSWRPYFRTTQSLQVYGPGYHDIDLSFKILDAKGYLSDRVTIKPIRIYPNTRSNNLNYRVNPSSVKINRPEHEEAITQETAPQVLEQDTLPLILEGVDSLENVEQE